MAALSPVQLITERYYRVYHQYEVVKDITKENILRAYNEAPQKLQFFLNERLSKYGNPVDVLSDVKKGQIAKVFGQGGGTQIQFGTGVVWYEKMGLLKEVVK